MKLIKIITVLFFTSLYFYSCSTQQNELKNANLKGDVYKIKQTEYEAIEKLGKYVPGEVNSYGQNYYFEFNEFGNYKIHQSFYGDGDIYENAEFIYNSDNICSEINIYDSDKKLKQKNINKIHEKLVVQVQTFDENGDLSKIYKYKYKGKNIIEGEILDKDGNLENTYKNQYEGDNLIKQDFLNEKGTIIQVGTFKHNSYNDLIESSYFFIKDSTTETSKFSYDYDKQNNWVRRYSFNANDEIENIIERKITYYLKRKLL